MDDKHYFHSLCSTLFDARGLLMLIILVLGLPGCNPTESVVESATETAPYNGALPTPTQNPDPDPSRSPEVFPKSTPELTPTAEIRVCSPFPDYRYADLVEAISNPFNPPVLGSDDPHQGVDFAVQQYGMALAGGPVQAVTAGKVALVLRERFPYGNAVLVEVPFDEPLQSWLDLEIPEALPTPLRRSALTCPELDSLPYPPGETRSLYLLYAHLEELEPIEREMPLRCGDRIGTIGQSGNALNPHLHLEARLGPAGTRFSGMAHYTTDASPEEMRNYCLWRVSGVFHLLDPLSLLEKLP